MSTIESAVGVNFGAADAMLGSAAVTPAAAAVWRNCRRVRFILFDVLELRRANEGPEEIADNFFGCSIALYVFLGNGFLLLAGQSIQNGQINFLDALFVPRKRFQCLPAIHNRTN